MKLPLCLQPWQSRGIREVVGVKPVDAPIYQILPDILARQSICNIIDVSIIWAQHADAHEEFTYSTEL